MEKLRRLVRRGTYDILQVVPCERATDDMRLTKAQTRHHVRHHLRRSGRRECQQGHSRVVATYLCDLQIAGAEVVAPLRDTVTLVHHDQPYR